MAVNSRVKYIVARLLKQVAYEHEDNIAFVEASDVYEAIVEINRLLALSHPQGNDDVIETLREMFPENENMQLSQYRTYHKVLGAVCESFILKLLGPVYECDVFVNTEVLNTLSKEEFLDHVDNFVYVFYEKSLHDTLDAEFVAKMWNSVDAMRAVSQCPELVVNEEWTEIPAWQALLEN